MPIVTVLQRLSLAQLRGYSKEPEFPFPRPSWATPGRCRLWGIGARLPPSCGPFLREPWGLGVQRNGMHVWNWGPLEQWAQDWGRV